MELRLTFKKKEIADLYQESYQTWDNGWKAHFKSKNLTTIILLSLTILTFGLTFIHFDWIYYGAIFFIITVIYDFRTRRQKRTADKEIKKWQDEVASFLKQYENIDDIKYIYDSEKIQYFEQGKLKVEILWDNILSMDTNDKWIFVYLKDPKQNFWIPRVTTDNEELKLFEQTIESRVQNGR
jgi:hypothetical protein